MIHSIVPPYLLATIARAEKHDMARAAAAARHALSADVPIREARARSQADAQADAQTDAQAEAQTIALEPVTDDETTSVSATKPDAKPTRPVVERTVFDAQNLEKLPGITVRTEGDGPGADVTVNEAYDALGATFAFFLDAFGRNSIDAKGLPLLATVHYGKDYDNAYWDGERMVFGDGDGEIFGRFTASVSVVGHELAHGVTQFTAGLAYEGQSGALNESFSDVMGALVEQHLNHQTAQDATWLIGAGLFTSAVQGRALRSMIEPGTAYDDDVLGKDPQPRDMAHYVETADDNGGVHLNSGIPNRAFALAAIEIGGYAWEKVGQVWYDTITGTLESNADFATFATATVAAATRKYGADSEIAAAVRAGWVKVGVLRDGDPR